MKGWLAACALALCAAPSWGQQELHESLEKDHPGLGLAVAASLQAASRLPEEQRLEALRRWGGPSSLYPTTGELAADLLFYSAKDAPGQGALVKALLGPHDPEGKLYAVFLSLSSRTRPPVRAEARLWKDVQGDGIVVPIEDILQDDPRGGPEWFDGSRVPAKAVLAVGEGPVLRGQTLTTYTLMSQSESKAEGDAGSGQGQAGAQETGLRLGPSDIIVYGNDRRRSWFMEPESASRSRLNYKRTLVEEGGHALVASVSADPTRALQAIEGQAAGLSPGISVQYAFRGASRLSWTQILALESGPEGPLAALDLKTFAGLSWEASSRVALKLSRWIETNTDRSAGYDSLHQGILIELDWILAQPVEASKPK